MCAPLLTASAPREALFFPFLLLLERCPARFLLFTSCLTLSTYLIVILTLGHVEPQRPTGHFPSLPTSRGRQIISITYGIGILCSVLDSPLTPQSFSGQGRPC
jgi:hypothetical protein